MANNKKKTSRVDFVALVEYMKTHAEQILKCSTQAQVQSLTEKALGIDVTLSAVQEALAVAKLQLPRRLARYKGGIRNQTASLLRVVVDAIRQLYTELALQPPDKLLKLQAYLVAPPTPAERDALKNELTKSAEEPQAAPAPSPPVQAAPSTSAPGDVKGVSPASVPPTRTVRVANQVPPRR